MPTIGNFVENQFSCDDITTDLTCEEEDKSDCEIKFPLDPASYPTGGIPPGEYCIKIRGCNPASQEDQCEDTEICIEFMDPCDPPELLQKPNFADQTYILEVADQGYDAPEFTVQPDFCPITYTTTITPITDDDGLTNQSGVTNVSTDTDLDFDFFWDRDDSPLT